MILVVTGILGEQLDAGGAYAQGAMLSIIQADFVRTRLVKGRDQTPSVVEEGSYFIAPDGRYRIDRVSNGVKTAEIVSHKEHKRIVLDFQTKRATLASSAILPLTPPPTSSTATAPQIVPGGPPSGFRTDRNMVKLGTKSVGGLLTLQGFLQVNTYSGPGRQFVHTMELWDYRSPDAPRMPPIVMETRFEGPDEIEERRLGIVTTALAPRSSFEIPADFTIR